VTAKLNRVMIGWANYFCLGPVSKAYRAVEATPARGWKRQQGEASEAPVNERVGNR
jgi:hypothetical protein